MTVEEKSKKIGKYCFGKNCNTECQIKDICNPIGGEFLSYESACDEALKIIKNIENDPVNRPAHYTDGKIEVIDFIEDKKLGFCLGNAVKYISRAGKKDPTKEIEDLNKAKWYIERRIKELQEV